jgi:dTDP-3-amino-3,4,6-trideoxy-alpha-D-glucose transaminase
MVRRGPGTGIQKADGLRYRCGCAIEAAGGFPVSLRLSKTVPFVDLARDHAPLAAELRAAFDRVLGASGFILGEEVERFEAEFASYCEAAHCVGVGSGTAALTIMLQAAGIGRGDEVIVPAHTFIATALAVLHAGATPVCVDVEAGTGLLDPVAVESAIGPATAGVIAVHLYGQVCRMDELRTIAERHGVALFEDAAQAHGATYRGRRAGGLARAGAFSFYPSKNLGALGDGGAICTNDSDLAARSRRLRDLGRDHDAGHAIVAYNERLDGVQAAWLRVKLPHLDGWNARRRALADGYRAQLGGAFELLEETDESPCIYHLFPVRLADRDGVSRELAATGIASGVHYPRALPDQPALRELWPRAAARGQADDPALSARGWAARELSLPIFPGMEADELAAVIAATERVTAGNHVVREAHG